MTDAEKPAIAAQPAPDARKLTRDTEHAIVGGVAAGIADYLNLDPTVVRVIFALVILLTFLTGLLAYILMWILIPPKAPEPV